MTAEAMGFSYTRCACGRMLSCEDICEVMAPNMNFRYVPFVVAIASCGEVACATYVLQRPGVYQAQGTLF
jgi:hypothetical protein